jgi:cysteinyl-tRNA synthetase
MALSLYNTLTRRLEPFTPLAPPRVTLYTCGPTVWNYAHIGNFRTFLFEDLLRRYLRQSGYDVFQIMNLTDVDDRIIKEAAKGGKSVAEHTAPFVDAFHKDRAFLRIENAEVYPRATESIPSMVTLVSRLLEKGVAYKADDDSVYFGIQRFPSYGRLSQLDKREIKVGARVASDEYAKDNPSDFALWKRASTEDEKVGAAWDAPFGRGRPGWHLECSAMSLEAIKPFGVETLDLHCGGVDLIFPHHEDEIAQSEAATGQPFARHWLHGAFLNVKGTKMSKRFGNFLTARDLQENGVDAGAFRHLVYSTHYRQELDFNDDALQAARQGSRRLREFRGRLNQAAAGQPEGARLVELADRFVAAFRAALDDDLNSSRALALMHDFTRDANRALDEKQVPGEATRGAWDLFAGTLDAHATVQTAEGTTSLPNPSVSGTGKGALSLDEARALAKQREDAKRRRDFGEADRIRAQLRDAGYEIRDNKDGTSDVRPLD